MYPSIHSISSLVARRYFRLWRGIVNRPITRVSCDRGIVGCIRNEDSLAHQPSSAFSLLACIHRYILFHRSSLACIFARGAASFDRPITRVACDRGIVGCIRNEDSLAYQPSSAFSLLACIHRYIHSISSLVAGLYFRLWCSIFRSAHHLRGLRPRYRRLHSQ